MRVSSEGTRSACSIVASETLARAAAAVMISRSTKAQPSASATARPTASPWAPCCLAIVTITGCIVAGARGDYRQGTPSTPRYACGMPQQELGELGALAVIARCVSRYWLGLGGSEIVQVANLPPRAPV